MDCIRQRGPMREAPDTGYAWVVAVAACLINLIMAGLGRMSGILYVAFIEGFQVSRKEATKPFSIRSSIRNLLGPIVGILGQQYGVRVVTVAGGVLATVSAALCYLAPDITWIAILWGALNGTGAAMTITLPQVVIGQHFNKYRTTAIGMTFSGGCVGSFLFPVLLEYLLHTYGLQGTFLIMAGIILHGIPAAMLLRRPAWMEVKTVSPNEASENTTKGFVNEGYHQSTDDVNSSSNDKKDFCESVAMASKNQCCHSDLSGEAQLNPGVIISVNKLEEPSLNGEEMQTSVTNEVSSKHNSQHNVSVSDHGPENVIPDIRKHQMSDEGSGFLSHIKTAIKLNTNPLFLLICLCRATHFVTFVPTMTVIVDYGMDKGLLEEHGKYIIAAISLGDLIGRLCLGWISDKGFLSLPKYMLVVMIMQGATTASFPLLHGMAAMLIMIALFGMLQGSLFIRHPVLVSKYMGKNEQSIAMGCMNFLSGLLGLALPYFIGYFRDTLGSYDHMFYITGAMGCTIGVLWILEPYLIKFSREEVKHS